MIRHPKRDRPYAWLTPRRRVIIAIALLITFCIASVLIFGSSWWGLALAIVFVIAVAPRGTVAEIWSAIRRNRWR